MLWKGLKDVTVEKKVKLTADAEVNLQVISISDCWIRSQKGVIFFPSCLYNVIQN